MSVSETPQSPQNPNGAQGFGNYQYAQNPQGIPDAQAPYNPQFAGQYGTAPIPVSQPQKKKGGCFKWGAITGGVILVVAVLASLNGGTDSTSNQTASSAMDTSIAAEVPSPNGDVTTEAVAEEPGQQQVSVEYKNALRKAKIYSDRMHMSKAGIYDQLTSEYGEKFSADAAQYAVDNLEADWNKNALEKARTYQDSMAMSPDGIFDQLTSEYGEKFTAEEAQYAVDNL